MTVDPHANLRISEEPQKTGKKRAREDEGGDEGGRNEHGRNKRPRRVDALQSSLAARTKLFDSYCTRKVTAAHPATDPDVVHARIESARAQLSWHQLPPAQDGTDAVRHPRWWFEDGDVVVSAPRDASDTRSRVLFKMHKEALAENMEFFESLFEMPHSGDDVDGAPMLEVGETAVQWALICVLLYTPREFGATPVLYSDIATLLDFSSRFQCIHFREAAVSLLSTLLPTRLENYLQRRRLCKVVGPQHLHAHVHALLLTHKIPELLPLARFEAACSSLEQLFNGWTDASTGETLRLPRSELARVLRGRDEVLRVRRDIALSCLRLHMLFRYDFRFTTNCTARRTPLDNDCSIALTDVVTEMRKAADTVYAPRLALAPLDRATRERLRKLLCGNCRAALRSRMARGQRHIWMCLPQMFGMGDWFEVERHGATVRKLEFQWAMKKEFGDEEEQGYYDEEAYDEENGQGNDADGGQEGEEAFGDAGEAAPEGTGQEHEDEWGRDDWSASGDSDSTAQYTDDTEFAEFDGPMDLGPGPGNTTFPEGFRWPIEEWTHEYPEPEPHPWQDEGSGPEWEVLPEE